MAVFSSPGQGNRAFPAVVLDGDRQGETGLEIGHGFLAGIDPQEQILAVESVVHRLNDGLGHVHGVAGNLEDDLAGIFPFEEIGDVPVDHRVECSPRVAGR